MKGDIDRDGDLDFDDIDRFVGILTASSASGLQAIPELSAVPEPTAAILVLPGLLWIGAYRRQRYRH